MTDSSELSGTGKIARGAAYEEAATAYGGPNTGSDHLLDQLVVPAVFSILGQVAGHHILDLACGAGHLARRLAEHGAQITAIDISNEMLKVARSREVQEPRGIIYHFSDSSDLSMIEDTTFDEVVCHMALMDIENLPGTVAEVARVVRLGGRFIFSIAHPCFVAPVIDEAETDSRGACIYYEEGPQFLEDPAGRQVWKVHRTLATYINAVAARGFTIRRMSEPRASDEAVAKNPELGRYQFCPVALIVEAVFPDV